MIMQQLIHDLMQKALAVPGADYMEVRIEETTRTSVLYSGKELERHWRNDRPRRLYSRCR